MQGDGSLSANGFVDVLRIQDKSLIFQFVKIFVVTVILMLINSFVLLQMLYIKLFLNTSSKLQFPIKLCMKILRTQALKTYFNLLFKFVNLSIYFLMILSTCLQLLYKLIQLSLRYNSFSFIICKFYQEHVTATDSKFCNILSI